jgi:hypothetical protein
MSLAGFFSFVALFVVLTMWLGIWCLVGLGCSGMAKVSNGAGSATGLLLGPIGIVMLISLAINRNDIGSDFSETENTAAWKNKGNLDPFA